MSRDEDISKMDDLFEDDPDEPANPEDRFVAMLKELEEPTEEEIERISAVLDRRHRLSEAHPLTIAAREYAEITHGVLQALDKGAGPPLDALVSLALETIGRFAWLIRSKTHRAVDGLIRPDEPGLKHDDDFDDNGPEHVQSDSNGCAKLVRLLVVESREAWEMLKHTPTIAADGVPAAMVRRLSELDAALEAAFPRAMEFVRAGFDDGGGLDGHG